jgi:signal transduction histidine kinase/CheY-like chemotaxis protein
MRKTSSITENQQNNTPNIDINIVTLNFLDINIEKTFRSDYFKKSLKNLRISFVTVIILYSAFGFLDSLTSFDYKSEFYIIRYLFVTPTLLIVLGLSFHKYFYRIWQLLLSFCFLISGIGIIYMLLRNPDNIFYYGGMFLIFFAGYFFIKLRFFAATITAVCLLITYNIGALLLHKYGDINFQHLIITNAFFISANIISMIALYHLEKLERKGFYHRILLSQTKNELALINETLEEQVKKRTHLLNLRNNKLSEQISYRKEIESKLISAKEKAEESDKLKSTFLATMSHELRTPLNSIIGFSDIINPDIPFDKVVEYAKIINTSGNHLLKIVDDLFDVAMIESGEIKIIKDNFKIAALMNEVDQMINSENSHLFKPDVEIRLEIPKDYQALEIYSDASKLKQILINLLKNALKFTESGHIEYGFSIKSKSENPHVEFYVKDTGIGISKNKQNLIFEIFRQVEDSDTRTYEGTGIGLSICRKLVNLLGGEINVDSEINRGSNFYFTIPLTKPKEAYAKQDNSIAIKKIPNKTLLIVEDDKSSYEYLDAITKSLNSKIIWAKNGKEAIDICKSNKSIDLVLMDINMPVMDGYTATKKIKKFMPDLPIIAQTAYAIAGDKEKSLEAGCDDYISKPIKRQLFYNIIEKYL